MKRILIVNNNLHIGGVQKALINLLWNIEKEYDVTLLLLYEGGAYIDQIPPSVKVMHVDSGYRYIGMTKYDIKSLKDRLGRLFYGGITRMIGRKYAISLMKIGQKKLDGFDVAISYMHSGGNRVFYGGCNEFVINHVHAPKKITFLHGDYILCGADTKQNAVIYDQFDKIAVCSSGCAKTILTGHPQWTEKTVVVPNCHRFEQIERLANLEPIIMPEDQIQILIVARLGNEKGVDRAMQVLALLQTKTPYHCHVVGNGIQYSMIHKFIKQHDLSDRVTLYGEKQNPYGYMKAADLLWIPSRSEAAPLVIGEAAFLKTPILSTETSSAREMIEERGYGWVCENSVEGMTAALQTLLEQPSKLRQVKNQMGQIETDNEAAIHAFVYCVEE